MENKKQVTPEQVKKHTRYGWLVIIVVAVFILLFKTTPFFGSKSSEDLYADSSYDRFETSIKTYRFSPEAEDDAKFIADNHYDSIKRVEAKKWLIAYQKEEEKEKQNSRNQEIEDSTKLIKVGKISILKMDDQETKCNLKKCYYILSNKNADSSGLAFAAKQLAEDLFHSVQKDETCPWPVMSAAYLYLRTTDYINDIGPVASCTITPDDYSGYVSVNTYLLNEARK